MGDLHLAGFELIEKIGEGGMGHVWKARQLSLDRLVAIKLLPPRFSHDPDSVRQIMTEARTAAKLKHPGIVQVYDASEQDGICYFVMEFVDGYNIGQWLTRKQVLTSKDALVVIEAVADALEYAWKSAGLIHCDLKPENIMVDQDGTIKVADLGLSLTRDTQVQEPTDEVVGTPGYISPEQVIGEEALDCRTDIYALGCCLYQMVTGVRPFRELSDMDAMEAQVSSQIPDPRDVVPGIPAPVCGLIERMLVKDRNYRLSDWEAVMAAIHRVQKGMMPLGKAPDEGMGTVHGRRLKSGSSKEDEAGAIRPKGEHGTPWGKIAVAGAVAAACVAFAAWRITSQKPAIEPVLKPLPAAPVVHQVTPVAPPVPPRVVPAPVHRVTPVVKDLETTRGEIKNVAAAYVARGELEEGARFLETYSGVWARETESDRLKEAKALRRNWAEQAAIRKTEADWQSCTRELAATILNGKYSAAEELGLKAARDERFAKHHDDLLVITDILGKMGSLSDKLALSFSNETGKIVSVALNRGTLKGRVVEVKDRVVVLETLDPVVRFDVRFDDLATTERAARMERFDCPEINLARAVPAYSGGRGDEAMALLEKTGPVLAPLLTGYIRGEKESAVRNAMAADKALTAFSRLMKLSDIEVGVFDQRAWQQAIMGCKMTRETASMVDKALEAYLAEYGASSFASKNPDLILALQTVCGQALGDSAPSVTPRAEAATEPSRGRSVSRARADDPVVAALIDKNPELLPSAVRITDEQGGRGLRVVSPFVKDLGPLSAMKDLVSLTLENPGHRGSISVSIAPLSGSGLKELRLKGYGIDELERLRGLKLRRLVIPGASLKSLSCLSGMPLVELDVSNASITDISSLRGLKLERLCLDFTKVGSIVPLIGMPLKDLSLRGIPMRDISYLRSLPLERLDLSDTVAFDYTALRGLKLKSLGLANTAIRDIGFCSDMPLDDLDLSGTKLPSLQPLKGKTMQRLRLSGSLIQDLGSLQWFTVGKLDLSRSQNTPQSIAVALGRAHYEELNLSNTDMERIECVKDNSNLRVLNLEGTKVAILTPLLTTPIEELNVKGTQVHEPAIFSAMKSLKTLETDFESWRLRWVVSNMPSLERVNGIPVSVWVEQVRERPQEMPKRDAAERPFRKRWP